MQIIDMTSLVCGLVFFGPFWPFVGRLMGFCLAALKMESNGSPVNGSDSNGSKKKATETVPGVAAIFLSSN